MDSFRIDEKQPNGNSLMKIIVIRWKVLAATFIGAIVLSVVSRTFVELDNARIFFSFYWTFCTEHKPSSYIGVSYTSL